MDDDSELESVSPGPLCWKTESNSQKAEMACVSNVTVHQHMHANIALKIRKILLYLKPCLQHSFTKHLWLYKSHKI